jgi:hypothetical protein
MANLVSLVMEFLTPELIARISSVLGIDQNKTEAAIKAAVPALLAGLAGLSSKPGGSQKLLDAVNQQSGGLDTLARMLGGSKTSSLANQGSQLLSSLLGSGAQSDLAAAMTKFAGLGEDKGGSLLGLLAPAVLGIIGKEAGPGGLNAAKLGSLLNSQKGNIAQALPSGFGDLLRGSPLAESLGGVLGTASSAARASTDAASRVASSTASTVGSVGEATTSAVPRWLYWVLPLLVVLGLLWYMMGNQAPETVAVTPPAAPSVVIGDMDVGKLISDNLTSLKTSLESVTDAASATNALPKLQEVDSQLAKIASALAQASTEQKSAVKGLLDPALAALNPLIDKVLAIPGVGDILRPTVEALKAKLAAVAA